MTRPISRLLGCGLNSHQSPIGIKATIAALTLTLAHIEPTKTVGSRKMSRYAYQFDGCPCMGTRLISAHGLGVSVVATTGCPGAGPNQITGFGPTLLSGSCPPPNRSVLKIPLRQSLLFLHRTRGSANPRGRRPIGCRARCLPRQGLLTRHRSSHRSRRPIA